MADNEDFDVDHLPGGSISRLLYADDVLGLDMDDTFSYSYCSSTEEPPKMLCFGNYQEECEMECMETTRTSLKSALVTCSDTSSATSSTSKKKNSVNTAVSKTNKKRNESAKESSTVAGAPSGNQGNCKKTKSANPMPSGHAKVRKENLGERITALQQLVSPYGKTDTASVLHEAMGYIRFLHDQVQVLCSPYLQRLPSSAHLSEGGGGGDGGETEGGESSKDLSCRGLCLVPVACTAHVANSNGADFWSPVSATR